MFYHDWGFTQNPFIQAALPPSQIGSGLLVGRDKEVEKVTNRLYAPPKLVTVEGRNGIGKTSVNNVAAYRAYKSVVDGGPGPLLIPCAEPFQLEEAAQLEVFIRKVMYSIALTLLNEQTELEQCGFKIPDTGPVSRWLRSPMQKTVQANLGGGFKVVEASAGVGKGEQANTSIGFAEAGFEQMIRSWLNDIFPTNEGGGVVCILDNLELLKTSQAARDAIEALRDRLFNVNGLRWVVCGAVGIVRGLASTPRMNGLLHSPIEIGDIDSKLAATVFDSRIAAYAVNNKPYLPLRSEDFTALFTILHNNIRDALSAADEYCLAVFEAKRKPVTDDEKRTEFFEWLKVECRNRLAAAEKILSDRPWQLFEDIVKEGGQCAPGDYEGFGFNSQQAMRGHVLDLERTSLIQSVRDEDDNRRKTILVTPSGWLVLFARHKGLGTMFENLI